MISKSNNGNKKNNNNKNNCKLFILSKNKKNKNNIERKINIATLVAQHGMSTSKLTANQSHGTYLALTVKRSKHVERFCNTNC